MDKDMFKERERSLEDVLDTIVHGVLAEGTEDDTAMLGVRWRD